MTEATVVGDLDEVEIMDRGLWTREMSPKFLAFIAVGCKRA